jgi:succinyl-CoA synthetase beta subunit
MNLHEYQAKQLLSKYGVPVPRGKMAATPQEARQIFRELGVAQCVVKSQVHAGGRGKAGGIKLVNSADEAEKVAKELIGKILVTHQTGPQGKVVSKLLVEESFKADRELYLGMVLDRKQAAPTLIVSSEGGMEIEELAQKAPDKIKRFPLHPHLGLQPYQAREIAYFLKLTPDKTTTPLFINFAKLFVDNDCSLAEINPLVYSKDKGLVALDAKINLDDRGLFRHKDLAAMRDIAEEHPQEAEAAKYDLSYIGLDGNIGCMVNGAGLAMATMDLIKLHGGEPANFLDVGGGASAEQVTQAFNLLLANKKVRAILVNIFGGIMKCDVIAQGIIAAAKETGLKLPLVIRLEGTNVEIGRKLLAESGLNLVTAATMDEAAKRVVQLAK